MKLLNKKRNSKAGYNGLFMLVDWDNTAKSYGLNYNFYKRILLIENQRVIGVERHSEAMVNQLKEKGYFVYDKTQEERMPREALFKRKADLMMGRLQLRRFEVFPEYLT